MASLKLSSLLLLFIISSFNIGCINSCDIVINGIGSVTPSGDVIQPVGKTLDILCNLDKENAKVQLGDSRNIFWKQNGVVVPDEKVQIIDNFTAALYIPNTTVEDSGIYNCYFNYSGTPIFVCHNNVMIGYAPKPVTDFSCVSPNWQYLLCSFTSPDYLIKPSYQLEIIRSKSAVSVCPLEGLKCNITKNSVTPYSASTEKYYFKLTAKNSLGKWEKQFDIDHYSIVLPNEPKFFRIANRSSRSMEVVWQEPVENFPPKFEYRLFYQSQWDSYAWHMMSVKRNTSIIISELQPFSNYELRLQCRSMTATSDKMWSTNATLRNQTLSEVPEIPPRITSGSFQERPYLTNRTIIIYWQMIPEFQKNGRGFKYDAKALPFGHTSGTLIYPSNYTNSYAIFEHLYLEVPYNFTLRSVNDDGFSESTYLIVEKKSVLPKQPESFTVIFYDNGIYELSWCAPKNMTGIDSFTLFWCSNIRPHPFPCNGNLSWTIVDKNVSMFNLTLHDDRVNYHFAISTNAHSASSGMVWATCIVPFNGTLNKMKNIVIEPKSSTQLKVSWNLDCSERIGIVTGFRIYYYETINKTDETVPCIDRQYTKNVNGSRAKEAILENLKPFVSYKITVAAITRAGIGEESDVHQVRTLEAPPAEAFHRSWIEDITNDSISLSWEPPIMPNGIITKYKIYYSNDRTTRKDISLDGTERRATLVNLTSYSNYTLYMQSCTKVGCSANSEPIFVHTKIGVPGKMSRPLISRLNGSSSVLVTFDAPSVPNGPVDFYRLFVEWKNEDNTMHTRWFTNISSTDYDVKTLCDESEHTNATLFFSLQAVNINDSEFLEGPLSEQASFPCITAIETDINIIIIVICSTFGITLLVFGLVMIYNRFTQTYKEIQNIKIHLPKGLEQESMKFPTEMSHVPAMPPKNNQQNLNAQELMKHLNPKLNGSPRSRNTSGDTRVSTSSMDELLQNSGDSKTDACSDGSSAIGSVSTAQTTRSNLSSDSGNDLDSLASITPDVVFDDNPVNGLKIQSILNGRNPSPPKIDEVAETSSLNSTPAHYSKFAHYLQNNDSSSAAIPMDGYISNFSVVPQESGYVLPSFQNGKTNEVLQYSQIGTASPEYLNLSNNIPLGRQINRTPENLTSMNSDLNMSYSSVGLAEELPVSPITEELMDDSSLGLGYTSIGLISNQLNPGNGYVSTALAQNSVPATDDKSDMFLINPVQPCALQNSNMKDSSYYSPSRKFPSLSDKYDELPPEAYSKIGLDNSKQNVAVNGYVPVSNSEMFLESLKSSAKTDSSSLLEDLSKPGTSMMNGDQTDGLSSRNCCNHSPEMLSPSEMVAPGKNGGYISLKSVAEAPNYVGNENLRNSGPYGRVVNRDDVPELKDKQSFS